MVQSHWWVIWSYSALKRWGNSGKLVGIYGPIFNRIFFHLSVQSGSIFHCYVIVYRRGNQMTVIYLLWRFHRLLLLQHVGVFFFKQAFHCLKQMLLLIVVGNGQGIERPLARRKQVAFSKVDLMCFFYMPTTKPRTAAELTVLHWDLGLLERCPSVPMAGCIRDTWLIGLSRPLTWRWWQSGDGTTVSKWHEKWCQNGFGGIFWGKQIVRYAKKHVKQWINRK